MSPENNRPSVALLGDELTWETLLDAPPASSLWDTRPDELHERIAGGSVPFISTCGLGVNSAAGLILLSKIGLRPDVILFADTGGEKAATYAYLPILMDWCDRVGFPPITVVKRRVDHERQIHDEKYDTLEQECLVKKCLPSIAYFRRSCSMKWKHDPQEYWANHWEPAQERWATGGKVLKSIYYEAGEESRAKRHFDEKYVYWHPLFDYGWGHEECVEAIRLEGLPIPPKSSCFFCPEMTPREIFALQRDEPEQLERALKLETNADLRTIKGLGKDQYSWRDLIDSKVPLDVIEKENRAGRMPCMCNDGGTCEATP